MLKTSQLVFQLCTMIFSGWRILPSGWGISPLRLCSLLVISLQAIILLNVAWWTISCPNWSYILLNKSSFQSLFWVLPSIIKHEHFSDQLWTVISATEHHKCFFASAPRLFQEFKLWINDVIYNLLNYLLTSMWIVELIRRRLFLLWHVKLLQCQCIKSSHSATASFSRMWSLSSCENVNKEQVLRA